MREASNSQEELMVELVTKGWIDHLKVVEGKREFQVEGIV